MSALHDLREKRRGRDRPLRILIAQLPIPELSFRRVRANEPIAPGYLKASLERGAAADGRARAVEVEILPNELVDRLGDRALALEVARREPDVLGISLFLWNSSRSVALARAARALRPELAVVVGGPEVTQDNPWCVADPAVDVGIVGEGEGTFGELVAWLLGEGPPELERIAGLAIPARSRRGLPLAGAPAVHHTPSRPAVDLATVPSPYLSGAIAPAWDGYMSVETLRGCPFKCSFCYYYKQFAKTQPFPRGWLQDHFRFAREHGMRELFFLDPTLNARPHFGEFLDEVARANEGGALDLHAELVADMVDERIADKLARANVKAVEVGLQSTNPVALKATNRMCDLDRFHAGVQRMAKRGITVQTDIIIGLPEDDAASVARSVEWVRARDLGAMVQVFHLMLLPGTELRERSGEFGYEFLRRPPYYATRTKWMDEPALRRAMEDASEAFGLDFDPPARPPVGAPAAPDARRLEAARAHAPGSYWSRTTCEPARFPSESAAREAGLAAGESAANAFAVTVRTRDLAADAGRAAAFLDGVVARNAHASVDVVVETERPCVVADLAALKSAAATPEAYLNGYDRFKVEPGTIVSTRVSVLARGRDLAAFESLEAVVPVIYGLPARSEGELETFLDAHPERLVLVERAGDLAGADRDRLCARLAQLVDDDADALSFATPEDARAWEVARGRDPAAAPPDVELVP